MVGTMAMITSLRPPPSRCPYHPDGRDADHHAAGADPAGLGDRPDSVSELRDLVQRDLVAAAPNSNAAARAPVAAARIVTRRCCMCLRTQSTVPTRCLRTASRIRVQSPAQAGGWSEGGRVGL